MKPLLEDGLEFGEPVKKKLKIAASAEEVWNVISSPGNVTNYHPFCKANPVYRWPGVGSHDEVIYYSGEINQRHCIKWLDGVGYDLNIRAKASGNSTKVSWRIEENQTGSTELSIVMTPCLQVGMRESKKNRKMNTLFADIASSYLDNVVNGVDVFVTTGVKVKRNQFDVHRLCSKIYVTKD